MPAEWGPEVLRAFYLAKALAERLEIAGLREAHREAVALRDHVWREFVVATEGQVGDRD